MAKWQPIMLITEKRFECKCGAMAIFVQLWSPDDDDDDAEDKQDWDYKAYCQDCFERAQETEEENCE